MIQHRAVRPIVAILAIACIALVPVVHGAVSERAQSAPAQAADAAQRTSRLSLDLVSRSYSASEGKWTIVLDATLNSNNICIKAVFDCVVGALNVPSGSTLVDLECRSPLWNHLLIFRNHCLKQFFVAGHHQKFRFTYKTAPQATPVTFGAEFGRGFLPYIFQQLATATLAVNLDDPLTVTKSCADTDGVDDAIFNPGATVTCAIVVDYPTPVTGPGAAVTAATLLDTVDPNVLASGSLAAPAGNTTWSCAVLTCVVIGGQQIDPGTSTTFTFTGTAVNNPTGGTGTNSVTLDWTVPTTGTASASDEITVKGSGDTPLTITKAATGTSVTVGQPLTWSITVNNSVAGALPATGVTVSDTASLIVGGTTTVLQGVTLQYQSGVGTWTCSGASCTAAAMPVGSTTFQATTVAMQPGTIVNEASVSWNNDILGPSAPEVAGASATADPVATTTTSASATTTAATSAPTSAPARLAFTG